MKKGSGKLVTDEIGWNPCNGRTKHGFFQKKKVVKKGWHFREEQQKTVILPHKNGNNYE